MLLVYHFQYAVHSGHKMLSMWLSVHRAVLSQVVDGVEKPITFYSRIMNSDQRNYYLTRRELLAVIAALQHFRHYLLCTHVTLRTGHHSLKWLKTFKRF